MWWPILPTNRARLCKQILGESFGVKMLHQKEEFLTGLKSLESIVPCKILILKASPTLILVGGRCKDSKKDSKRHQCSADLSWTEFKEITATTRSGTGDLPRVFETCSQIRSSFVSLPDPSKAKARGG